MFDDLTRELTGILLSITLLLVLKQCIELWVQRATSTRAAAVNGEAITLLSSQSRWAGRGMRTRELKLACGGYPVVIGGAWGEPFAEIFFRIDWSSQISKFIPIIKAKFPVKWTLNVWPPQRTRIGGSTRVQLTVDQVDFGVRHCCTGNCSARNQSECVKNCKTVFIHKMTIEVRPKAWAQDCRRLLLQPHRTAQVFGLQRSSNGSFQMPFIYPKQASFTYQTGNTVSRGAPPFGWLPAATNPATNFVSWTWQQFRYATGGKLEFNQHRWGFRPPLGVRADHTHIGPGSFLANAMWELNPDADLQQHQLKWDLKVTVNTALLQRKRRLPGYSLSMGPTLSFVKVLAFS